MLCFKLYNLFGWMAHSVAILILLSFVVALESVAAASLDRSGKILWSVPSTNASVIIEASTNLTTGVLLPERAYSGSKLTNIFSMGLTNAMKFFRVTVTEGVSGGSGGMSLVPAGYFWMGDNTAASISGTHTNERPRHMVFVSSFLIDRLEGRNEEVRQLLQTAYDRDLIAVDRSGKVSNKQGRSVTLIQLKGIPDSVAHNQLNFTNGVFFVDNGKENNPCVGVSWYGAAAFANWRSEAEGLEPCFDFETWECDFSKNGYRLPTEAEWEKAARGGMTGHNYPWESPMTGRFIDQINETIVTFTPVGQPHPFRTTPVGFYNGSQSENGQDMINGYGLYDVAGNVREWCYDWFRPDWYAQPEALLPDPKGPSSGVEIQFPNKTSGPTRITRGGSFDEPQKNVRCAFRGQAYQSSPDYTHWYHGFRLARNAPSGN